MLVLISKYKLFGSSSGVCPPDVCRSYMMSESTETKQQLPKPQFSDSFLFWGASVAFSVLLCEAGLGSSSLQYLSPGILGLLIFLIFQEGYSFLF